MKLKEIKSLFFVYLIAHGLSLGFLDAQFYDDILFFNYDLDVFISELKNNGDIFDHRLKIWLFLRPYGPGVAGLISFILYFISAILIFQIIKTQFTLDKKIPLLFSIFYLIIPFGIIKFSFSMIPYLICMNFFLLGWYYINRIRILSLFFFLMSFNMQSLLVLYSLPIFIYYLSTKKKNKFELNSIKNFIINKIDFIILPFLFFSFKINYFKPTGYFENYNYNFDITNLIEAPVLQFLDIFRNNLSIGFLFLGLFVSYLLVNYFNQTINIQKNKKNFNILIVIPSLFASVFPYWIIGHVPTFSGYSSRHQFLLLITFPFLIIYFLKFLNSKFYKYNLIIIFTLCLSINFKSYSDYYIDYMKQKKLVNFIKKNKEKFSRNNVVIFNDKIKNPTVTYNQFSSQWRNGIFKRALGHEKNYVIHVSQIEAYLNGKFDSKFDGHHLAKDHVREDKTNFIFLNIESKGLLNFEFSIEKILIN